MAGRRSNKTSEIVTITPEMIEAAARELVRFDPDYSTAREGAERLLLAAFAAVESV